MDELGLRQTPFGVCERNVESSADPFEIVMPLVQMSFSSY